MGNTVRDDFNRPDGPLGVAPGGFGWQVLRGQVRIATGRALSTFPTPGSLAAVDVGLDGQDGTVSLDTGEAGGDALYWRVVDAGTWLRLGMRRYTITSQTGTEQYISGYTQVQVGTNRVLTGYQQVIVGYKQTYVGQETYVVRYEQVQTGTTQTLTGYQQVVVGYNYSTTVTYIKVNASNGVVIPSNSPQYEAPFQNTKYHNYPTAGYPVFPGEFPDLGSNSVGHVFRATNPTYAVAGSVSESRPVYRTDAVYEQRPVYATRDIYRSDPIYGTQAVYQDQPIYEQRPVYASRAVFTTVPAVDVTCDRSLNGTITTLRTERYDQALTVPGVLSVRFDNTGHAVLHPITGVDWWTFTDSTGLTVSRHGFGSIEPAGATTTTAPNSDGIDGWQFQPARGGRYVPYIVL